VGDFYRLHQGAQTTPGVDKKSTKPAHILRRSKGYVLVGDNLYKLGSASDILMKCVRMKEGNEILQEIYKSACGNHAASRTLVEKSFKSRFY
jgi:hypothetical protein